MYANIAYMTTSIRLSAETRELLREVQEQLSLVVERPVSADLAIHTLILRWKTTKRIPIRMEAGDGQHGEPEKES